MRAAPVMGVSAVGAFLSRQPAWALTVLMGAAVLGMGALDYYTGFELSFALFYLLPVSAAAWYGGPPAGIPIALFSAVTWFLSNRLAGEVLSSPLLPYWNAATRLGFFVVVAMLLVELRRRLERERELSRTDFLTGALNSRAFHEVVELELARAARHGRALTAAYLDLDNFKAVNDRFGHATGDELLRTMVQMILSQVRKVDIVARLGGDEFALLLPETDAAAAKLLLPRIQTAMLSEMRRREWPVTFSIGVLTCVALPKTPDDLIREVDQLMYEVKGGSKNAIEYRTRAS